MYETLLEYTRGIDSRFPVNVLAEKIKERGIKDKKTKKNAYQMEFLVREGRYSRHHVPLIGVQGDLHAGCDLDCSVDIALHCPSN